MKNNIKKASVKFWKDLLYFSILCKLLSLESEDVTLSSLGRVIQTTFGLKYIFFFRFYFICYYYYYFEKVVCSQASFTMQIK